MLRARTGSGARRARRGSRAMAVGRSLAVGQCVCVARTMAEPANERGWVIIERAMSAVDGSALWVQMQKICDVQQELYTKLLGENRTLRNCLQICARDEKRSLVIVIVIVAPPTGNDGHTGRPRAPASRRRRCAFCACSERARALEREGGR